MQTNPDLMQSIELNSMITSKIQGLLYVLSKAEDIDNKQDTILKNQLFQMYSLHKSIKKKFKNI